MSRQDNPFSALLPLADAELSTCRRCGDCKANCPVYGEKLMERYTARGKMMMIQALARGELEPTQGVRDAIDNCLLCTGCVNRCGNHIRADKLVMMARHVFAKHQGTPLVKKMISATLSQPSGLLDAQSSLGSRLMPLFFKKVPATSGLFRRFPMPMADGKQYVPELARRSFRATYKPNLPPGGEKALFFTGCMINYAMTPIAESLIRIMTALGVEIVVPAGQECCGMPMAGGGDFDAALARARKNLEAFKGDSIIITACASCGHMLREGYLDICGEDSTMRRQLRSMAERTMDVTEYLCRHVGLDRIRRVLSCPTGLTTAYHDPCHLRKAQGITEEPRALIAAATGAPVRELRSPDACCGLGGTYALTHLALSKQIQAKKIAEIHATGAETLLTACPGCILQLEDGLRRQPGLPKRVLHVVEAMAATLPAQAERACVHATATAAKGDPG